MSSPRFRMVEKKYVKLDNSNVQGFTDIEVMVDYDRGDQYMCKSHGRGFYVHFQPMRREGRVISYTPNDGETFRLLTVGRYTKAGEKEALGILEKVKEAALRRMCTRHGLMMVCDVAQSA